MKYVSPRSIRLLSFLISLLCCGACLEPPSLVHQPIESQIGVDAAISDNRTTVVADIRNASIRDFACYGGTITETWEDPQLYLVGLRQVKPIKPFLLAGEVPGTQGARKAYLKLLMTKDKEIPDRFILRDATVESLSSGCHPAELLDVCVLDEDMFYRNGVFRMVRKKHKNAKCSELAAIAENITRLDLRGVNRDDLFAVQYFPSLQTVTISPNTDLEAALLPLNSKVVEAP